MQESESRDGFNWYLEEYYNCFFLAKASKKKNPQKIFTNSLCYKFFTVLHASTSGIILTLDKHFTFIFKNELR